MKEQQKLEKNVLGPNHIKVATSYNNLGSVYKAMGELQLAKHYYEKAMGITSTH